MKQVVEQLRVITHEVNYPADIIYLPEQFKEDCDDQTWMNECKKNRWLPITRDLSKTNNGPKLSRICREIQHPHVRISPNVSGQRAAEQVMAIISVWRELYEIWSGANIKLSHTLVFNNDRTKYRIKSA